MITGIDTKPVDLNWTTPPITTGGVWMMVIGVIVVFIAGINTLMAQEGVSTMRSIVEAVVAGAFLVCGMLLFGFGFLSRRQRKSE